MTDYQLDFSRFLSEKEEYYLFGNDYLKIKNPENESKHCMVRIFHFDPNAKEAFKFICPFLIKKGDSVLYVKQILVEVFLKYKICLMVRNCRLRNKVWNQPGEVFCDYQRFKIDIPLGTSSEMCLYDIPFGQLSISIHYELVLFIRRWRPSELKLGRFKEIVVSKDSISHLKWRISEMTDIPYSKVEVALQKGYFPYRISLFDIQNNLDWNTKAKQLSDWQWSVFQDGASVIYRDSREEIKILSDKDHDKITALECDICCSYPLSIYCQKSF